MKGTGVICIVQARMGSDRLPGKVMKKIMGEPMIGYTLKRLRKCETLTEVVLATSEADGDTELAEYVEGIGFSCVRGSEDDVLERYTFANRRFGCGVVVRVTGDCPLIDPALVDLTVRAFAADNVDYLNLDVAGTAINGFNTEVFSAEALERTYDIVSKLEDCKNYKEHVTIYMYRHPEEFTLGMVSAGEGLSRPYRLCVDEIDDFRVVEAIYNHFKNPYPSAREIVGFLDGNSEVAFINRHVQQKKA